MADKRFQLTFDVNANLSNLNNALTKMKADFKNLNLSDSINKDLNKTFTQLEQEINKFTALTNKKTFNIQEINEANKSFQRISNLFNTLQVQTNKIKGIKLENLVPTESINKVKQLNKALEDLENISLGKVSQEIEKLNKALNDAKAEQKVSKATYEGKKGEQTALDTARDNLQKQLEEERKKVDELREAYNTLNEVVENRDEKAIEDAKNNLEKEQQTLDKLQTSYNKAATAADKAAVATAKAKTAYDTQHASVLALTKQLEELKNGQGNLESIRQELHELGGIDLGELPTDLDELIKKVEELKTKELSVPNNGLKNIDNNADEAAAAVHELNVETEKQVETGRGYNEQARDLENLANQVKQFFSIGNTVQLFKRAIRSAFDTIKELDAVMTQTAVVTDFTVGDMWAQLPEYTKRANELGVSVKGAYEAATLYYQQGLSTNEVIGVSNETLKMAKIAAIDYATATDYMTSALRGFNMEVNEQSAKKVNDIYSQLAAKTAADTEEISIAMSKTAPLAHNAGMEIETTAAFLAQAIETTREAPETIGTAMKTVIARFQELKKDPALIEPVEGEIVDANKIEGALRSIGVALRDTSGQFRDLDDVFLEISQKWNSLDTNTQRYIATIAAGSRQQSRFIAMMANYDRTMELVEMANTSAGASQQQFEKTLDSMQSKLDRLKNAWNEFTMGLANNSIIKTVVDLLTDLLNTINKISSGVSGNNGILKSLVDIGILMGGLKLGRAAFSGFFGWLQGKGKTEGVKVGEGLSKGLLNSILSNLNKGSGKITSIFSSLINIPKVLKRDFIDLTSYIYNIKTGLWNFSDIIVNLNQNGYTGLAKILRTLKEIPPQTYAIAGGIAAAVAVLALFIKGIKDSSIDGRLKQAKESTKKAEEAANQAKEAYDKLLEGKSQYSQLQENLDNLTYGTQAWKEALIEANGQVLELLQTFPQLAQYITSGVNGRIEISSEGWDTVLEQQQEAIRRTTNNLLGAQIYQANLENEKLYKDLQKSTNIQRKGLLNELISQYENNAAFFTKDKEGNYSKELQQVANTWGVNPEKIYEAQNAIREYEAAIQQNGAVISSYTDSLIANNAQIDNLSSEIAKSIKDSYNKTIGENYNDRFEEELSKLRGDKEVASNLNSILDEYGLNITGTTKKKLQELYKYLANITGEEIDEGILDSKSAMQEAIVRMRLGDEIQSGFEQIAEMIETDTSGGVQKVLDVLGGNFEKFSSAELMKFGNLANKGMKDFADDMGLTEDEFKQVLDSLGYSFEEFKTEFANAADEMAEQIKQSKINLVQAMIDTGAFKNSRALMASLANLSDQQITAMSGIANQVSGLGSNTQAAILKSLPNLFRTDEASVTDLFKGLDFSDPINSLKILQEEAENSTSAVGKLAQQIISMEPELFSAGNLFKDFMQSADFENLSDDVQDFIKNNGKISASNVKELAKQSNKLNNLLKTGTVSAGALAKAFTAISTANVPMESFTTHVLEALSAVNTFDDRLGTLQENLANFDPGLDESALLDSFSGYIEKLEGYAEKGQYNNTAFQNYFRQVYGEEGLAKVIQSGDGQQIANAFDSKIAQAKQWLSGDGYGFWADLASDASDALVSFNEQGDIFIDTAGRTTDELIADLSKISGASEDFVAAQLAGFSAHSFDLRKELAENDFNKQIQQLMSFDGNQLAVLNESEIQAFAIATGQDFDDVITQINEQTEGKIKIVNFIDEETGVGALGDDLIGMIEDQLSGVEGKFNFLEDLDLADAVKIDKNGTLLLDIEQITGRLEELGLTAEQINSIFESDSFNNWLQNAQSSIQSSFENQLPEDITRITDTLLSKTIEIPVKAVDEETGQEYVEIKEVVVTADSVEGLTAAENAAMEAANYDLVGQSIVNQDFSALGSSVEGILKTAAENAASTLKSEVNGVKFNSKSIKVKVTYQEVGKPAILSLQGYKRGTTLDLSNVWSRLGTKTTTPSVNSNSKENRPSGGESHGGHYAKNLASGTEYGSLKHDEIALTGEEGYELAYNEDGAFLLGEKGPEVVKLKKGTVIYPHDLSKKILNSTSKKSFPSYATGIYTAAQKAEGGVYVNTSSFAGSFDSLASSMKEAAEAAEEVTEETEKWENNVDWLYNMTQQVNHQLRVRDKLERQYNRLLKTHTGTGEELKRITEEEIASLRKRQDMEKQMIELRKKELYTYMMLNKEMMKYAIIDNWDDMTIHIAWDSINAVTDPEEGKRIEEFINKLETIVSQVYDLEDDIEDIEDEIIELKERGKDEYRDLEDRVLAALISEQQEMIDEQEKTIKAINNAEKDLVDAIQKNIDKMRQDRDNEEKESSLAEKERRLAYLRQDTTGSNALEIKQLEKELEKEKQDYTDTLIDQAIKDMKEQADKASEQRERQIELLQQQLDWQEKTGYWVDEATRIVQDGLGPNGIMDRNSRLYQLLYEQEGVITNSNASRDKWDEDLANSISLAFGWLKGYLDTGAQTTETGSDRDIMAEMIAQSNKGKAANKGMTVLGQLEEERNAKIDANGLGDKYTKTYMVDNYKRGYNGYNNSTDSKTDWMAMVNEAISDNNWSDAFFYAGKRDAKIDADPDSGYSSQWTFDTVFDKWYASGRRTFKLGGLADFTGPAWLDGTKSKPEMVLNAKDTENFIQLKDILSSLRSGIVGRNTQGGDWYFDIDINVDEIANDYDVDKVAARIKQSIYEETAYRNVNAINFLK